MRKRLFYQQQNIPSQDDGTLIPNRPYAPTRQADIQQNAPFILRRAPGRFDTPPELPPLPIRPYQVPLVLNRSGTIAVAGQAQDAAPDNYDRNLLIIQNPSTAAEVLYYDFGQDAQIEGASLVLAAGQGVVLDVRVPTQRVSVVAATAGHLFFMKEGSSPWGVLIPESPPAP